MKSKVFLAAFLLAFGVSSATAGIRLVVPLGTVAHHAKPTEPTAPSESDPSDYFSKDGATVKCLGAPDGATAVLDGVEYRAVYSQEDAREYASVACTSNLTDMSALFARTAGYDPAPLDLSHWDVSQVTDMSRMFLNNHTVNPSGLATWDTSSVTTMKEMFRDAISFNQPIATWNVSNVTNMKGMFLRAYAFTQDLSGWCSNPAASAELPVCE